MSVLDNLSYRRSIQKELDEIKIAYISKPESLTLLSMAYNARYIIKGGIKPILDEVMKQLPDKLVKVMNKYGVSPQRIIKSRRFVSGVSCRKCSTRLANRVLIPIIRDRRKDASDDDFKYLSASMPFIINKIIKVMLKHGAIVKENDKYIYPKEGREALKKLSIDNVTFNKVPILVADDFQHEFIKGGYLLAKPPFKVGSCLSRLVNRVNDTVVALDKKFIKEMLDAGSRIGDDSRSLAKMLNKLAEEEFGGFQPIRSAPSIAYCHYALKNMILESANSTMWLTKLVELLDILDSEGLKPLIKPTTSLDRWGRTTYKALHSDSNKSGGMPYGMFKLVEPYRLESDEALVIFKAEIARRYGISGTLSYKVKWLEDNEEMVVNVGLGGLEGTYDLTDAGFRYSCREYVRFLSEGIDTFSSQMYCALEIEQCRLMRAGVASPCKQLILDDEGYVDAEAMMTKAIGYTCEERNPLLRRKWLGKEVKNPLEFFNGFCNKHADFVKALNSNELRNYLVNDSISLESPRVPMKGLLRHFPHLFEGLNARELFEVFRVIRIYQPALVIMDRGDKVLMDAIHNYDGNGVVKVDTYYLGEHQVQELDIYTFLTPSSKHKRDGSIHTGFKPKLSYLLNNLTFGELFAKVIEETIPDASNLLIDSNIGRVMGNPNELIPLASEDIELTKQFWMEYRKCRVRNKFNSITRNIRPLLDSINKPLFT